jgi:hypothetical protein
MTQYIKIPVTEFTEALHSIEDLLFNTAPTDKAGFQAWKEQVEMRCNAARAIGVLQAYCYSHSSFKAGKQNAN